MKLLPFFDAISPFLTGKASHAQAVDALYGGPQAGEKDAARLAIYGNFCAIHRHEAAGGVHRETKEAVVRIAGEPLWERLVEQFFAAHPMRHAELNDNAAGLAAWLQANGAPLGLPAWVGELAELEWWEWRTQIAADDPADQTPGEGPLRLASTVELRPFHHDLVGWLDEGREAGQPAPAQQEVVVLFWRDADLDPLRANASPEELQLLALVHGRAKVDADGPLGETLDDLRAAGILLGRL